MKVEACSFRTTRALERLFAPSFCVLAACAPRGAGREVPPPAPVAAETQIAGVPRGTSRFDAPDELGGNTGRFAEAAPYFDVFAIAEEPWFSRYVEGEEDARLRRGHIVLGRFGLDGAEAHMARIDAPCGGAPPVGPSVQLGESGLVATWWCAEWTQRNPRVDSPDSFVDFHYRDEGHWQFRFQRLKWTPDLSLVPLHEVRTLQVSPVWPCGPAVFDDPAVGMRVFMMQYAGLIPEIFEYRPEVHDPKETVRSVGLIAEAVSKTFPDGCWGPESDLVDGVSSLQTPFGPSSNGLLNSALVSGSPCWRMFSNDQLLRFERACHLEFIGADAGSHHVYLSLAPGLMTDRTRLVWRESGSGWTLTAGEVESTRKISVERRPEVHAALQRAYGALQGEPGAPSGPAVPSPGTRLTEAAERHIRVAIGGRDILVQWDAESAPGAASVGSGLGPAWAMRDYKAVSPPWISAHLWYSDMIEWTGVGWSGGCGRLDVLFRGKPGAEVVLCHVATARQAAFFVRGSQSLRPMVVNGEPVVVVGSSSGVLRLERLAWCEAEECTAPVLE